MENKNSRFIKPEYIRPELSTKLYRTTYSYLKKFYSEQLFEDICNELQMPIDYLRKDDNWVSVAFGRAFATKVREKTGDPEIYRKIGKYYLSPDNINPFELAIIKNLSPFLMLKSIRQFYRKGNTICDVNIKKHSAAHITMEIKSDVDMYYDMALNTLGIAEAFQDLYGLEKFDTGLTVETGKPIYSFSISIKFSAYKYYTKKALNFLALITIGLFFGFSVYETEDLLGYKIVPLLFALVCILGYTIFRLSETIKEFKKYNEEYYARTREKNLELYNKAELLERRYMEANLLKKLSAELISCSDPGAVITKCLNSIKENFGYERTAVFLISKERGKLYLSNSIGFENANLDTSKIEFLFPNPDKKEGFIATVIERGQTALVEDIDTYKSILKPVNKSLLDVLEVGSMIISPIQSKSEKFGAVLLINSKADRTLNTSDKFLIENIASQLSLYFESATNFQNEMKLRHIFQKYVPSTVLEQITTNLHTSDGALAPQKKQICSLFMDLRGFTAACDKVPPEKAFELINLFSQFTTEILSSEGAIIDNIVGDEIVCFFPKSSSSQLDHIFAALNAAQKICANFGTFTSKLEQNGFAKLRLGIGIHCGEASVGSVGGNKKMNFTALGRTVNIASRLQSISKKFEGDTVVVVSQETISELGLAKSYKINSEILRGTTEHTEFTVLTKFDLEKICGDKYLQRRVS